MISSNQYQDFIYTRTYARWRPDLGRRENWDETVGRYMDFMAGQLPAGDQSLQRIMDHIEQMIKDKQVMPSMRALWTAGPALARENICGYNCSYAPLDHPKAFAELLYILLCGTGVGFSVERQVINKLWEIPAKLRSDPTRTITVSDSKRGWAEGFYSLLRSLWNGVIPAYDLSLVRPAGAPLKTFGGRASGPGPLRELFEFTIDLFRRRAGGKLNSLDCNDMACKAAQAVVVGGVRRSACICLTNLSDDRMAKAKSGSFHALHPHRSMANISVAYTERPSSRKLISEWIKLIESNSGERGIFNRADINRHLPARREERDDWGINPCGEIVLQPNQFCNLTEVVVRPDDNHNQLGEKVRAATILGMVQGTLSKFNFLRKCWTDNTRKEHLLGVSLTGLADHPVLSCVSDDSKSILTHLHNQALLTAREWAKILDCPVPAAITCVKPSGTVSQLVGCASGLHSRYAPYYIRRVRVATVDPICSYLMDKEVPNHPEVGQAEGSCNTRVFEFPEKSPPNSRMNQDTTAIEQLEYWHMLKTFWCNHNPSCTIFVREEEWVDVLAWVHEHWTDIGGLSFLPADSGGYQLPPLEEIDKDTYDCLVRAMPVLDFTDLNQYERADLGHGYAELACSGGACAF